MKLLKVEKEIYHLKRHFKVDRHQMSHCYLSVKAKNNTRKWYFEYFIADYFPTLNKKDPVCENETASLDTSGSSNIIYTLDITIYQSPAHYHKHNVLHTHKCTSQSFSHKIISIKKHSTGIVDSDQKCDI